MKPPGPKTDPPSNMPFGPPIVMGLSPVWTTGPMVSVCGVLMGPICGIVGIVGIAGILGIAGIDGMAGVSVCGVLMGPIVGVVMGPMESPAVVGHVGMSLVMEMPSLRLLQQI